MSLQKEVTFTVNASKNTINLPAFDYSNFEQRKYTHFIGFVQVYCNFLTDHLNYLHNMHIMKRKREVDGENYNYMLLRHEMTSI